MKFNVNALGIACAIIWGGMIFLMTLATLWWDYPYSMLNLIADGFMWGYSISYFGAFVGLVYGLIEGYLSGALFALIYNKFVKNK